MIRSLRMRLLAGTSLAWIVILSLVGISVYLAMRHALVRDFDAALRVDARLAGGMVDDDDGKLAFDFDSQQMPEFLSSASRRFFEIWRDDGSVLGRSPSLGSRDLPRGASIGMATEIDLPDSHCGRAIITSLEVSPEEHGKTPIGHAAVEVTILVAAEPREVYRTLELLAWLLTILCLTSLIIMGLVLLRVVGHGLRPLTQLAAEIGALRETNLSHRLSGDTGPTELAPITDKLNGLLSRLDQAFTREKSFTADVSHELRTPLAGLRSTLEVCRSRPRDTVAYESALDDCLSITDRMEAMVQALLLLARSDAGQLRVERRPIDLAQLVAESWRLFESRARQRGLNVALNLPPDRVVATDPDKLRIVLENLLDNAVSYTDDGGTIRVEVQQEVAATTIEIANTGSRIATEDTPHLFDRFWRGDTARTDAGLHCGLGLSISQRLIALLGGEIDIRTSKGAEFMVRLRFPSSVRSG